MTESSRTVRVAGPNPELASLALSWSTAMFTHEDGIGPMGSLQQAGDSVAVIARYTNGVLQAMGSGVMVAPGIMLTATHVLHELRDSDPIILTFVPNGEARLWLPQHSCNASHRENVVVGPPSTLHSDLSMVSCDLYSEAHEGFPLMLAPMAIELPVPGQRLWAYGYRDGEIDEGATRLAPLVSSGVVSQCFPDGRGRMCPGPCVEIQMEAYGGMSGGPVVNENGDLVAIVSTSFEDGPTYATLIWDALRLRASGLPEGIWSESDISLLEARDAGLARMQGEVHRSKEGTFVINLPDAEMQLVAAMKSGGA